MSEIPNSIPNIVNKNVILGGDFSLFFNTRQKSDLKEEILDKTYWDKGNLGLAWYMEN